MDYKKNRINLPNCKFHPELMFFLLSDAFFQTMHNANDNNSFNDANYIENNRQHLSYKMT